MKKCIIILIAIITVVSSIIILFYIKYPKDDLNLILKQYGAKNSEFIIYDKENIQTQQNNYSQKVKKRLEQISGNEKVLHFTFKQKKIKPAQEPNEIYALFKIWLNVQEKDVNYEHILAVSMDFEINNLSYATKKEIVVLRDEFEEIQRQISNEDKEEKSEIRLAQLWINKYCYNRNGLVDVEEWKGLLSPWKSSIDCIKENISYCAQYSNYYKSIGIQKTSYNESGNKFAAADIFSDQLEETGYIYGTWGENFDLWIWGETTGFQYYKFNPEQEQWNEETYTNETVPTLLTEVQRSINQ